MKRGARVSVGILAAVGLAAIVLTLFAPMVVDCSGQRISRAVSPSGNRVAEHHQVTCRSNPVPKTHIHLIQNSERVSTHIGSSTANSIALAWSDDDTLVISVPPGLDKAFDRKMQGVNLEFRVVPAATRATPDASIEQAR